MEEKTVPWWRKALSYALSGIRSGFGLFARSAKNEVAEEPGIVAGQQENTEEEAELTKDSPKLESVAVTVSEVDTVAAPDTVVVTGLAEARVDETSGALPVQPVAEPAPQLEPEAEAAVETVAAVERAFEVAPKETAEESSAQIESREEPASVPEIPAEPVDAHPVVAESSAEVAPEVLPDREAADEFLAADEVPVEPSKNYETAPGPITDPIEPAEIAGRPQAETEAVAEDEADAGPEIEVPVEAEVEAVDDPAVMEEPIDEVAAAVDTVPEPEGSPVEIPVDIPMEIIEPPTEETHNQIAGQPAADEDESVDEAAPLAEASLADSPAPETAGQPMDLADSIPEQTAATAAAGEASSPPGAAVGVVIHADEPADGPADEPAVPSAETAEPPAEQAAEASSEEPSEEPVPAIAPEPAQEEAAASAFDVAAPFTQEPAPPSQPAAKPFIKLETRDNEADLSPFSVIVSQVYDGPLDLLLDLIRKQDIDIYDIPIARITAQFLAYVNQLKATDVDVAGEFIYTASLLIHIKSKMLLPRAPAGSDETAEDPRRELVERLLEHERFKNAAQMLQQKQMLEAATWTNPGIREFQDDVSAEPEIAADTVDLVRVFRDILERARNRPVINVEEDSVTVGQMIQFLARRLTMEDKPVALRRLLSHTRSEKALIAMFLALLELVRLQAILLRQDRAFSEIFIKKHTGFDSVMNEGLANARDDWR
jgi:segregation and condensation protein A